MDSCKSTVNDAAPATVPNITEIVTHYDGGGGGFSQVNIVVVSDNHN